MSVSLLLYTKLSPLYFSQWAMGNSIVFLSLLWLDAGFKKSIPRFYPLFLCDTRYHTRFIVGTVTAQLLLLLCGLMPFMYTLPRFITLNFLHPLLTVLFLIEGLGAIFQIIYHAHFKQKQFNLLQISCTIIEVVAQLYCIMYTTSELHMIKYLFIIKTLSGLGILIGSLILLPHLYNEQLLPLQSLTNPLQTTKDFISHTLLMWASTIIKSLTERNFLFPYVTSTFGSLIANSFKVSHDGALFFQRIALKALGTADTSLLSYVHAQATYTKKDLSHVFASMVRTVTTLTFSLGFIGLLVFLARHAIGHNEMFSIFLIVGFGYMLEIFLSPYERILEIKQNYRSLWIAYTPYLIGIIVLAAVRYCMPLKLITMILCVHVLRSMSSLIMWHKGKRLLTK